MHIVNTILKYPRLIAFFIIAMAIAMTYTPKSMRDDARAADAGEAQPQYTSAGNPWAAE